MSYFKSMLVWLIHVAPPSVLYFTRTVCFPSLIPLTWMAQEVWPSVQSKVVLPMTLSPLRIWIIRLSPSWASVR